MVLLILTIGYEDLSAQEKEISLSFPGGTDVIRGATFQVELLITSTVPVLQKRIITSLGTVTEVSPDLYEVETLPTTLLGPVNIYAYVVFTDGDRLETEAQQIHVEPDTQYDSIRLELEMEWFHYIGELSRLYIYGIGQDGKEVSLAGSKRLTFRSLDTSVADITELETDYVVVTGHGETEIEVTYTDPVTQLVLTARAPIGHDPHQVGNLDTTPGIEVGDFNVVKEVIDNAEGGSQAVQTANDERDINNDGVINWDDLEAISLLCDHLNCSFRPYQEGQPTPTPVIILGGQAQRTGDYNGDCIVDQADYDLWRSQYGTSGLEYIPGDGTGDGKVDAADYALWRNNLNLVVPDCPEEEESVAESTPAPATTSVPQQAEIAPPEEAEQIAAVQDSPSTSPTAAVNNSSIIGKKRCSNYRHRLKKLRRKKKASDLSKRAVRRFKRLRNKIAKCRKNS